MNPIASIEIQQKRLDTCMDCPKYQIDKDKCTECGCYVSYKIYLKKSKCPLNKW